MMSSQVDPSFEELKIAETDMNPPINQMSQSSSQRRLFPTPPSFEEVQLTCLVLPGFTESAEARITFDLERLPADLRIRPSVPHEMFLPLPMGPWLPQVVLKLLEKGKKRTLSDGEAAHLMDLLAHRAVKHYNLPEGKFVAVAFSGRIMESADTKIDLLKKVQGQRYPEQIFLWQVGSDSFTGWRI